MGKTVFAEFGWENVTDVRLPERSILYAPAPIGMGTAFGESLTSYLARLAEAHCVYLGVLLQEMMVPLMAETEVQSNGTEQHPLWRRDGSGSHLINVTSPRARAALQVLEMLTLRTDLRGLSLTALTDLLPIRGLTRNTLAWCPLCYEEHTCSPHRVHMFAPTLCGKNWTSGRVSPTRGSRLNASAKLSHHLKEGGRMALLILVMHFHPAKGESKNTYPMC